jgi:hypothetical protein
MIRRFVILGVLGDVAEESWRIMAPILKAWADGRPPFLEYSARVIHVSIWEDAGQAEDFEYLHCAASGGPALPSFSGCGEILSLRSS